MNKSITKKVLVVSNYALDNTTDLFKLVNKMKNNLRTLPTYIDYVTYKGTNFLKFITAKYSQGYRIIIGDFYSSQCLSVFKFLDNHRDLLLISSASTATFTKQMPTNLIRLASDDEKSFSLFKNSFLDSMNQVLLSVDSTLSKFPRQKEIINLNDKTFVKTVNVLYTDEDIYNLSYVRMIKRNITGKESYKFKFYKIDSATIAQNKLTPEATAILKTTDASNVFMIITISYAQQFLNILSSNYEYIFQIMFLCDAFISSKLVIKNQLLYTYTMINENSPRTIDYFQRLLFNGPGYINYYTLSILCFLKLHTELINNNILNDLTTTDMIEILTRGNEYINGQPINTKKSIISVPFESLSQETDPKKRMGCKTQINTQSNGSFMSAAAAALVLKDGKENTEPKVTTTTVVTEQNIFEIYKIKDLVNFNDIKEVIDGIQYIMDNPLYDLEIEEMSYLKGCLTFLDNDENEISFDEYIDIDFRYSNSQSIQGWLFILFFNIMRYYSSIRSYKIKYTLEYNQNDAIFYLYIGPTLIDSKINNLIPGIPFNTFLKYEPEIIINNKKIKWIDFYNKCIEIFYMFFG